MDSCRDGTDFPFQIESEPPPLSPFTPMKPSSCNSPSVSQTPCPKPSPSLSPLPCLPFTHTIISSYLSPSPPSALDISIRPFLISRSVRSRHEEAAVRLASAARTAALFPSDKSLSQESDSRANPFRFYKWTFQSSRINPNQDLPPSSLDYAERPVQSATPTLHSLSQVSALSTPLPSSWMALRSSDQEDSIGRGIADMRHEFVPPKRVAKSVTTPGIQPRPRGGVAKNAVPVRRGSGRPALPKQARPLFKVPLRTQGVQHQKANNDPEDEEINVEEGSPPHQSFLLYRLSADGTHKPLPLTVTPLQQKRPNPSLMLVPQRPNGRGETSQADAQLFDTRRERNRTDHHSNNSSWVQPSTTIAPKTARDNSDEGRTLTKVAINKRVLSEEGASAAPKHCSNSKDNMPRVASNSVSVAARGNEYSNNILPLAGGTDLEDDDLQVLLVKKKNEEEPNFVILSSDSSPESENMIEPQNKKKHKKKKVHFKTESQVKVDFSSMYENEDDDFPDLINSFSPSGTEGPGKVSVTEVTLEDIEANKSMHKEDEDSSEASTVVFEAASVTDTASDGLAHCENNSKNCKPNTKAIDIGQTNKPGKNKHRCGDDVPNFTLLQNSSDDGSLPSPKGKSLSPQKIKPSLERKGGRRLAFSNVIHVHSIESTEDNRMEEELCNDLDSHNTRGDYATETTRYIEMGKDESQVQNSLVTPTHESVFPDSDEVLNKPLGNESQSDQCESADPSSTLFVSDGHLILPIHTMKGLNVDYVEIVQMLHNYRQSANAQGHNANDREDNADKIIEDKRCLTVKIDITNDVALDKKEITAALEKIPIEENNFCESQDPQKIAFTNIDTTAGQGPVSVEHLGKTFFPHGHTVVGENDIVTDQGPSVTIPGNQLIPEVVRVDVENNANYQSPQKSEDDKDHLQEEISVPEDVICQEVAIKEKTMENQEKLQENMLNEEESNMVTELYVVDHAGITTQADNVSAEVISQENFVDLQINQENIVHSGNIERYVTQTGSIQQENAYHSSSVQENGSLQSGIVLQETTRDIIQENVVHTGSTDQENFLHSKTINQNTAGTELNDQENMVLEGIVDQDSNVHAEDVHQENTLPAEVIRKENTSYEEIIDLENNMPTEIIIPETAAHERLKIEENSVNEDQTSDNINIRNKETKCGYEKSTETNGNGVQETTGDIIQENVHTGSTDQEIFLHSKTINQNTADTELNDHENVVPEDIVDQDNNVHAEDVHQENSLPAEVIRKENTSYEKTIDLENNMPTEIIIQENAAHERLKIEENSVNEDQISDNINIRNKETKCVYEKSTETNGNGDHDHEDTQSCKVSHQEEIAKQTPVMHQNVCDSAIFRGGDAGMKNEESCGNEKNRTDRIIISSQENNEIKHTGIRIATEEEDISRHGNREDQLTNQGVAKELNIKTQQDQGSDGRQESKIKENSQQQIVIELDGSKETNETLNREIDFVPETNQSGITEQLQSDNIIKHETEIEEGHQNKNADETYEKKEKQSIQEVFSNSETQISPNVNGLQRKKSESQCDKVISPDIYQVVQSKVKAYGTVSSEFDDTGINMKSLSETPIPRWHPDDSERDETLRPKTCISEIGEISNKNLLSESQGLKKPHIYTVKGDQTVKQAIHSLDVCDHDAICQKFKRLKGPLSLDGSDDTDCLPVWKKKYLSAVQELIVETAFIYERKKMAWVKENLQGRSLNVDLEIPELELTQPGIQEQGANNYLCLNMAPKQSLEGSQTDVHSPMDRNSMDLGRNECRTSSRNITENSIYDDSSLGIVRSVEGSLSDIKLEKDLAMNVTENSQMVTSRCIVLADEPRDLMKPKSSGVICSEAHNLKELVNEVKLEDSGIGYSETGELKPQDKGPLPCDPNIKVISNLTHIVQKAESVRGLSMMDFVKGISEKINQLKIGPEERQRQRAHIPTRTKDRHDFNKTLEDFFQNYKQLEQESVSERTQCSNGENDPLIIVDSTQSETLPATIVETASESSNGMEEKRNNELSLSNKSSKKRSCDTIDTGTTTSKGRKRGRKGKDITLKKIDVPLDDLHMRFLKVLETAGDALVTSLKSKTLCVVMGVRQRFATLQPHQTRILLNHVLKTNKSSSSCGSEDQYKELLALHGLVKSADLLVHYGILSATRCLSEFHNTHRILIPDRYVEVMESLDQLQRGVDDLSHPKVKVVLEQINRVRKRSDPCEADVKVLVLTRRENAVVSQQLKMHLGKDAVHCLDSVPAYQEVLLVLDKHSVVVWEGREGLQELPSSQFSLVVQWEALGKASPCVDHCVRQNIEVVALTSSPQDHRHQALPGLSKQIQGNEVEKNANAGEEGRCKGKNTIEDNEARGKGKKELDNFTFIASSKVVNDAELHYILTSTFNITLVERSARDLVDGEECERGWPDLVLDERTCVLVQPLIHLRTETQVHQVVKQLVLLSLQCTSCYLLLYSHPPLDSGRYVFRSAVVRALVRLVATCAQFRSEDYTVSILLAHNLQEVGQVVRKVGEACRAASVSWDKEEWTSRSWLTHHMSSHERLLLCLPCINPISAQVMLTALPLPKLLTSPLQSLVTSLPWIPYKIISLLHRLIHGEENMVNIETDSTVFQQSEQPSQNVSSGKSRYSLVEKEPAVKTTGFPHSFTGEKKIYTHTNEVCEQSTSAFNEDIHKPQRDMVINEHCNNHWEMPELGQTSQSLLYPNQQQSCGQTSQYAMVYPMQQQQLPFHQLQHPVEYSSQIEQQGIGNVQPQFPQQFLHKTQIHDAHQVQYNPIRHEQQLVQLMQSQAMDELKQESLKHLYKYLEAQEQDKANEPNSNCHLTKNAPAIQSPYFSQVPDSLLYAEPASNPIQSGSSRYFRGMVERRGRTRKQIGPQNRRLGIERGQPTIDQFTNSSRRFQEELTNNPYSLGQTSSYNSVGTGNINNTQQTYWASPFREQPLPADRKICGIANQYHPEDPERLPPVPPSPRVTLRQSGRSHDFPTDYVPSSQRRGQQGATRLAYKKVSGAGGQTRLVFRRML